MQLLVASLTKKQNKKLFNTLGQQCLGKHNGFLLIWMIFTHERQKKFIHHSPTRLVYDSVCQYQKVLFRSCAKQLDFFGTSPDCSPKISGFLVTAGFLVEEMTLMKNRKSTQIWMCLSQLQKQHILRHCLTCSVNYILMWKTILFFLHKRDTNYKKTEVLFS